MHSYLLKMVSLWGVQRHPHPERLVVDGPYELRHVVLAVHIWVVFLVEVERAQRQLEATDATSEAAPVLFG